VDSKFNELTKIFFDQTGKVEDNFKETKVFFCNFLRDFDQYLQADSPVIFLKSSSGNLERYQSLITTDTIKGCMESDESSSGYKLTFYLRILDGNHIDSHTGDSCMITILITAQKEEHNFLVKVCDKEFDLSKNILLNRDDYKDMYDHIYTQIQDKISNTWSNKMSLTI
jgi:hypothetical protein